MSGDTQTQPALAASAVGSLVIGLLALVPWLMPVAGPIALVLGWLSLRRINLSDGRLQGSRLAITGMVLGGLGTFVFVLGLVVNGLLTMQERANMVGCQNNLRNIGQALGFFHDRHNQFPAATMPAPDLPPERRLSWLAAILPYLHPELEGKPGRIDRARSAFQLLHTDLAWDAEENRPAVSMVLADYQCPAHRLPGQPGAPALSDYFGFAGLGPDAASLPMSDQRAGFFGYDRVLTRQQLQEARGQSTTAVTTEAASQDGPWAAGGPATVRGLDPASQPYFGSMRQMGGIHRGGAYVLYADGSVLFMKDTIEPQILEALVTIRPPEP